MEQTNPASTLSLAVAIELQVGDEWHEVTKLVRRINVDATETADGGRSNVQSFGDVTLTYGDSDTEVTYAHDDEVTYRYSEAE